MQLKIMGALRALAAAWRAPDLVDVARKRPVWQSSYHGHGTRDLGPDGSHPNKGFRRTRPEHDPWWMIDLQQDRPIYVIRLHNNAGAGARHASRVIVSISSDRDHWQVVRAGVHFFGDPAAPWPLEIRLLNLRSARYLRLDLPGEGALCLRRVEVMVERRHGGRDALHRPRFAIPYLRALRAARRRHRQERDIAQARFAEGAGLVDLAPGRATRQSSRPDGESSADAGRPADMPFVATRHEARPWWMIDLGLGYPIHLIRIHNRSGRAALLAARLSVAVSDDGDHWEVVHAGLHVFGDDESPWPLDIRLLNTCTARFVRLELPEPGVLTFRQIEVLADRQAIALLEVCRRYGFVLRHMLPTPSDKRRYTVENPPASFDGAPSAFHLARPIGRFGNHLKSILHAVCLARKLGIKRIYLPPLSQFVIAAPFEAGGVTLLPAHMMAQHGPGAILSGPFYYRGAFGDHLAEIPASDDVWATRDFVRPLFARTASNPPVRAAETDLAIHIRSGDLFAKEPPNPDYVQPPLSYYQLIIDHARRSLGVDRVILVYEDDANPCVDALQDWLRGIGLPFVTQSASLGEDLATLMQARHCVFGYGTFGTAVLRLSARMRTVFAPWTMVALPDVARIFGVRPVIVHDRTGGYLRAGSWRNTAEQRRMMLAYPIENLRLEEDPRPGADSANEADG